jgi:hypothetical protein
MNIAAAMATIRAVDLDSTAKFAVLVLACHADQHQGVATVKIESLAAELGKSYGTTWRALQRAVEAGHLVVEPVDKRPNQPRTWQLVSRADARPRSREIAAEVARGMQKGRAPTRDRRIFKEKNKESAGAIARHPASASALVDKATPPVPAVPPSVNGAPSPDWAANLRGVRSAQALLRAKRGQP